MNRLKTIKRQMYCWGSFELLRRRVAKTPVLTKSAEEPKSQVATIRKDPHLEVLQMDSCIPKRRRLQSRSAQTFQNFLEMKMFDRSTINHL